MTEDIRVYCSAELKELAGQTADKEALPLSEWIVKVIAQRLGRPDLQEIPRKKPGRPRKSLDVA